MNNGISNSMKALYVAGPILAGIVALLIIFAGTHVSRAEYAPESSSSEVLIQRGVEVAGLSSVAYAVDDEVIFSDALQAYLDANSLSATQATALADPAGSNKLFYVSLEDETLLKVSVRDGVAARYIFTVCSEPVAGINAPKDAEASTAIEEEAESSSSAVVSSSVVPAEAPEETPAAEAEEQASQVEAAKQIKVTDKETLASYLGDDADILPAVITAYLESKGITADGTTATIDESSIVRNGDDVSFLIVCGGTTINAEYADDLFGLELR